MVFAFSILGKVKKRTRTLYVLFTWKNKSKTVKGKTTRDRMLYSIGR